MNIPESEIKTENNTIENLISIISHNNPDVTIDIIMQAYNYAQNAHKGQLRLSGEPYIVHPLAVAYILAEIKMDVPTIVAALLHDVVEDTTTSINIISEKFGKDTALLVDGVTKISSLKKQTKFIEQAQTLRKMLAATINDARVIIIKLADKLHNMRTIEFQSAFKQEQIAKEVLEIYAPMAGRLGMSKIRSELEDIAFKVLLPVEYNEIANKVVGKKHDIEAYITTIKLILQEKLQEVNIKSEISGRAKHYYSIYRKMELGHKSFDEIFDIRAIRLITEEIKDCYGILGIIHAIWTPIASRFKDYIAVPKSNMYQSLHTTVIGPDGHPLEIQIRTREMHATSEIGIASHSLYKESPSKLSKEYKNLTLLKNIEKRQLDQDEPDEFMKELKMDLYEDEIFVFTPKGKIVKLAKGSTAIDFAYAIHTEVGHKCVGAKVNNAIVPLKTELESGDIIEILTNKNGHPSESWLKIVKSSNARYKIRNYLRSKEQETLLQQSEEKPHISKTAAVTIPDNELIKIKNVSKKNKPTLSINGTYNIQIKLSQCCQPIPGDDVIGFITRGRGLTIHRKSCSSIKKMNSEKERFINIVWENSENTYPVKVVIDAIDRQNLLKDVANELALCKANVIKMEGNVKQGANVKFKFVLEVQSINHLNELISKLSTIRNVTNVHKLNEKVTLK